MQFNRVRTEQSIKNLKEIIKGSNNTFVIKTAKTLISRRKEDLKKIINGQKRTS